MEESVVTTGGWRHGNLNEVAEASETGGPHKENTVGEIPPAQYRRS